MDPHHSPSNMQEDLLSSSASTQHTASDSTSSGSPTSLQASPTQEDNKRDIPLLKLYSTDTDHHPPAHSPSPSPPLSSSPSAEFGIRRRTRTSSSGDKVDGTSGGSGSGGMVRPSSTHSALSRKSSELAMLRELAISNGPTPSSSSRTSRTLLKVETSTSPSSSSSSSTTDMTPPSSTTTTPTPPLGGGRYTMLSGAYQRTSVSTGSLVLSRPSTPTLTHHGGGDHGGGSPSGGSPRGGGGSSPDTNGGLLPRSASDQTPKKKSMDDFHIGRVLGEGAYGAVVEATDKETGAQYAIKILEKKHIVREKKVKYATTERGDILGQCFHPGIVKLFYTFSSEASLYYVLELCPNGELLGQIKKYGGFNEDCVRFYTAEIIEALEYLHTKGVVHRDLKPENILMSADWHLKVTDFGTAKMLGTERTARANSFVGTAEYVSPELVESKETGSPSDLWSLGSIVYQMCTNRLAFRGKTRWLTFNKVKTRDITFPINFPPLAKDLVENLLSLQPEERLGAREGGYAELKAHPFFKGIAWGNLRDQTPPTLSKPTMSIIFDESSPPSSPTSAQLLRTSSNNILLNGSPSNSPRLRANSETQKWATFLNADETVKYTTLVWKRKGLSIKKRHLLLTNTPRLIYIDPKKMVVRGEIPWSENLRPELKSSANFYVHTPKRKYILEDMSNNAASWVEQIQSAITAYKATKV